MKNIHCKLNIQKIESFPFLNRTSTSLLCLTLSCLTLPCNIYVYIIYTYICIIYIYIYIYIYYVLSHQYNCLYKCNPLDKFCKICTYFCPFLPLFVTFFLINFIGILNSLLVNSKTFRKKVFPLSLIHITTRDFN